MTWSPDAVWSTLVLHCGDFTAGESYFQEHCLRYIQQTMAVPGWDAAGKEDWVSGAFYNVFLRFLLTRCQGINWLPAWALYAHTCRLSGETCATIVGLLEQTNGRERNYLHAAIRSVGEDTVPGQHMVTTEHFQLVAKVRPLQGCAMRTVGLAMIVTAVFRSWRTCSWRPACPQKTR